MGEEWMFWGIARHTSLILAVFGLVIAGFAHGEGAEMRIQNSDVAARLAKLNYPKLPEEVIAKTPAPMGLQIDSAFAQDYALNEIGYFSIFTPLVQPIQAKYKPCSREVVVAVVDTGIDYTHPELKDHLWVNPGETGPWKNPAGKLAACQDKSCNGIDDDNDGYVDDVVGWDFVHDVPLPFDNHGHGTHISGIVSATGSNGIGSAGVCPGAKIMALKYYDNTGFGYNNLQNTVRAIHYAINHGANIINYSGGGTDPAPAERMAIELAAKKNILFVAAAGNEGRNNDFSPYYPASYPIDNIVSVASVDRNKDFLPSSNYGKNVLIGAPGLAIYSSLPHNKFGTMSGTSQATAFVTGAAALLWSQVDLNKVSYTQIKTWLKDGAAPMKPDTENQGPNKHLVAAGLLSLPGSLEAQAKTTKKPVLAAPAPEIARKGK